MSRWIAVVVTLLVLPGAAQETSEERRARQKKINDLSKSLRSKDEEVRLQAVRALGEIRHRDARKYLSRPLTSASVRERDAAMRALVAQKHPSVAAAFGKAILAQKKSSERVQELIGALGDLDQCASLKPLVACIQMNNCQYTKEVLGAITRIGCPEAAPGLLPLLRVAEKEEREPDTIEEQVNQGGGRVTIRTRPNPSKNFPLARTAPAIRSALRSLAGSGPPPGRSYAAWVTGGALKKKLVSVYYCSARNETFTSEAKRQVDCPLAEKGVRHEDTFLKHRPQ